MFFILVFVNTHRRQVASAEMPLEMLSQNTKDIHKSYGQ